MIRLRNVPLPQNARLQLANYQSSIDRLDGYEDRVKKAQRLFSNYNRNTNSAFRVVRLKLVEMCSGARRCCYCEDSFANQVEHIKPKDLYPGETFKWRNYVYACS